ncbi:MAG: pitrilysin family protein [Opitutales bacterium]
MQALIRHICLLSASLCALIASADDALEPVQTLEGIEEYELRSNGLRVLLMPNQGLPVATVMVTYEVGSRHEVVGTTGATHLLEHMMFKGTPRFNAEDKNDYASIMERIGARSNATTWFDRTNYYATLPSEHVPLAIELEADRMRNLLIREEDLASEMTVVRNEYERGENNPVRTLIKELFAAAFTAHTYSHPTIGWKSDIENTSPSKLREFYDTFYWPENAVLTVIGGFDREATMEAIVEHYGAIKPAPESIPEVETVEPEQIGPRRVTIERAGQVGVVMVGYKVPEATHTDWPALLLIDQIVGADKTGRLYRALEDKGKASATFTFAPELHDPGLFVFGAYLTPSATHEEVEATLQKEIEALIGGGVTEEELKRAKSVIRADIIYGRDGPYSIADQINEAIAMGDWTSYVNRPEAIEAVTTEEIQAVAERYFRKKTSTTGWFVPDVKNSLSMQSGRPGGPNYYRDPEIYGPTGNEATDGGSEGGNGGSKGVPAVVDFSANMRRETVAGIDLITVDMPIEDAVSFVGGFAAGEALSPNDRPMLAALTAAMLDKGSARKDRFAIAELLNTLGADIAFGADNHSLTFSGRFLRPDAGTVLELLAEQLREPAFNPDVFETVRSRQEAKLLQAVDDPGYRAGAQISRMLYPMAHPNRSEELNTLLADLKRTNIEDLRHFHRQFYGPESMRLVFAGDIDFEQIKAAVANAFDGWTGGVPYTDDDAAPAQLENASEQERIYIADKTSVSVTYGYNTGLQRSQDEYLPFMLGNYILGGSFNSRLMSEIRKKRGLTYGIGTTHEGDLLTPGNWTLTASFSPDTLDKGLKATEEVLHEWHDEGVSEDETEAAIETLTGAYLVGLSTTSRVAAQIHSFLQRGLEPEYIDKYPLELKKLSNEQVNRAIRQYLDPASAKRVAAGSFRNLPSPMDASQNNTVSVRLDTPNPGWRIQIEKIYRSGENLVVISRLTQSEKMAAQVITSVADSAEIPPDIDLPVRHYIIGKTWNWGDTGKYTYIDSMEAFDTALDEAELIYSN